MNKRLELNFWPILYDSIVFLCLQTQKVYLKQNIISLSGWAYFFGPPCRSYSDSTSSVL